MLNWLSKQKQKQALKNYFYTLNRLQQLIFAIYLAKDYADKRNEYEIKISQARLTFLKSMKKIRQVFSATEHKVLIEKLVHLYEMIIALLSLAARVQDSSLFTVCEAEMRVTHQQLSQIFNKFMQAKKPNLKNFSAVISAFDELFHSTLQIVAPDPLVFLFFIQTLTALYEEFRFFNQLYVKNKFPKKLAKARISHA